MDHEGDNSLLYLQKNRLDGSAKKPIKKTSPPILNGSAPQQRRASLTSNSDSSRRDSTGKFTSPNTKEDVIPRYLRASTGSCHDFCKYGKRHAVEEEKPWRSYSKKVAKTPPGKLRSKESANSANKVTEVKHIPRETNTQAEDLNLLPDKDVLDPSPDETISQDSSGIIEHEVSLPPLEIELSPDILETVKDVLNPSPGKTISQSSSEIIENEGSLPHLEIEPSPDKLEAAKDVLDASTILQSSEIIENEVSLPPKEVAPDKLETAKDVLEHAPLLQPKAVLVKASPSEMPEGNLRKGIINRKIKDGKLPQVSNPSQGPLKSRKPGEMKDRKTLADSKASQKEVLRSSTNLPSSMVSTNKVRNLTPRKNNIFKLVPLKDQTIIRKTVNTKQLKNEIDARKTLAKPVRRIGATSSRNRKEEDGEGKRDEEKTGGMDDAATNKDASKGKRKESSEGRITRTLRKGTTIKTNDSSPVKLSFRKGKVVQPHSDNNAPRRLKFRRGLTLMGNKDGITDAKKTFKKGVVDDKDVADSSSKRVVLRHQAVQNKKIDPVLLNNVIEETASKLVGTRKSKVKALVGAFETVISLHESKSPTKAAS